MSDRVRIDLGDEDYALLLSEKTHGTQKRCNDISRPALIYPETKLTMGSDRDIIKNQIQSGEVYIDWAKVNTEALNDALILGQVVEWSFGEVTEKVLDGIPETKYQTLMLKINEVFGDPLAVSGIES